MCVCVCVRVCVCVCVCVRVRTYVLAVLIRPIGVSHECVGDDSCAVCGEVLQYTAVHLVFGVVVC